MDGPEPHSKWLKASLLILICCITGLKSENTTTTESFSSSSTTTDGIELTTIFSSVTTETTPTESSSANTTTLLTTPRGWCRTSTDCIVGGVCVGSRCMCLPGYVSNYTHCVTPTLAGSPCRRSSECVKGAECISSICTCNEVFYVTSTDQCRFRLRVGENCQKDEQCRVNSVCQNRTCNCSLDYFPLNDECIRRLSEGDKCNETTLCVENARCSDDEVCVCDSDYFASGGYCKPKVPYGDSCTKDEECLENNTICKVTSKVCTCDEHYFYYAEMSKCIRVNSLRPTVTVKEYGSRSIKLTWETTLPGDCQMCSYRIKYFYSKGTNEILDTNETKIELTGLKSGQNYTVIVKTLYQEEDGNIISRNSEIHKKTMESQAENFTVTNITSSSVVVSFRVPQKEDRDIFRLEIKNRDTDRNKVFCVVLYRNTSQGNVCGDYISTGDQDKTKCRDNVSLTHERKLIVYNVTGLDVYTNYTITVVMVTCNNGQPDESGPSSKNISTSAAIPGQVLNIQTNSNITHLCATWTAPNPDPGPLRYNVILRDNVNNSTVPLERQVMDTSWCYGDFSRFWEYMFVVTATTSAGAGREQKSDVIITPRGDAGSVTGLKVVTADGICYGSSSTFPHTNYRQILVHWKDPEPEDRGTRLTRYNLTVSNNKERSWSIDIFKGDNNTMYRRTRSKQREVSVQVTPGMSYSFKLTTFDDEERNFPVKLGSCSAPIGVPPKWTDSSGKFSKITDTTLTLQFEHPVFYKDDTNGPITESGFIISTSYNIEDVDPRQITEAWKPNSRLYRVSGPEDINNDGLVTLGADSDCSGISFCNGELQPETLYYVVVFVCTEKGCEKSSRLGPFETKATDNTVTIAVALVGVAFFVGVTVVVAAFLWRFRRTDHMPLQLSMRPKIDLSKIPRERPIQLACIEARVNELHADSNRLFSMHYEDLIRVSPKHPTHAANMDENKQKNRWVNVLPFDGSRVKLSIIDNDETSDYINASYIPGYNWDKEYIASQGPLPGTVDDFWRMIWELDVSMIVMVTPVKENGKVKCEEYWPVNVQEPKEYGNIVVENISFSSLNMYNVTIFKLIMGNEDEFRTVKHFHFLNWKDMSANVERSDIINFVRTVRSYLRPDMEGPMVVHCSAGVGRTGTFIVLDYLIQFIENHDLDESVDIYGLILKMRENRVLMVQTESQYVFLHDCALQLVEEKRAAMDSVSENELLYVNTEMGPALSEEEHTV